VSGVRVVWVGEHYEVRRDAGAGPGEVIARCPHCQQGEPRATVRLPASSSLRRLGRRFIGRG
jgi:hypothetical protein